MIVKIFPDNLSNSGIAGRRYSEVRGNWFRLKNTLGDDMPQYLVAVHHPDNYDPSTEDEAMVREIDVLNEEMEVAGAWFFRRAWPATSAPHAKSRRKRPGGDVVITDGPYLETKEPIGGFWILNAAGMDEALAWGRKAVVACRASVEVREFLVMPNPEQGASKMEKAYNRRTHPALDGVIQHSADEGDFLYSDWTTPYRDRRRPRCNPRGVWRELLICCLAAAAYDIWSGFWLQGGRARSDGGPHQCGDKIYCHPPSGKS